MSQDQTDNLVISTRPYFITLLVCIFFGFLGIHLFLLDRWKRGLIYVSFWVFFILVVALDVDLGTTTPVELVAGFGAATATFFWMRDIIFLLMGKMKDGSGQRTYSLSTYTEYVWKQKPKVQKTLETIEKAQNELEQKAKKQTQTINETRESNRLINEMQQQEKIEENARIEIERENARQQREQEKAQKAKQKQMKTGDDFIDQFIDESDS